MQSPCHAQLNWFKYSKKNKKFKYLLTCYLSENMKLREYIIISFRSIKSNLLRTVLTIIIIAIGISSLVGILTTIDGLQESISSNFALMGSNTFNIRKKGSGPKMRGGRKKIRHYRGISYKEVNTFEKEYKFPALVSGSTTASFMSTVKYGAKKTNPNVKITGVDEEYLGTAGFKLYTGRNFSKQELHYGMNVALLGMDLQQKLFESTDSILNKKISVGNRPYRVIGLLEEKGASMLFSMDNVVLIPIKNARAHYQIPNRSYVISVAVSDVTRMEAATGEATGLFRKIRRVPLGEEDDFEIVKSDSLAKDLIENLKYISIAATVIGMITLLGAAIGLMNILLVAVSERTREIGLSKAIGATASVIKKQLLIEAILICQIGGACGIIIGIILGNVVALIIGGTFIIPWVWMLAGVSLCLFVGVAAGIYPAIKASRLNPIDALRYE